MKEITVSARTESIEAVTAFIEKQLESLDCSPKAQMQINVAIDEIASNIAYYAYPDGEGTFSVGIREENGIAEIVFKDQGIPYDPLQASVPELSLSAEDRPLGGLGIHMVKKMMDAVSYRYENGQNILTLQKQIKKG